MSEFPLRASGRCPWCGENTLVTQVETYAFLTDNPHRHLEDRRGYSVYRDKRGGNWWLGRCNNPPCIGFPILAEFAGDILVRLLPQPQPEAIDSRIPDPINRDLREARLCKSVGAIYATATMARRALQNTLLHAGAKKKDRLVDQIDDLAKQNKITADLQQWAHEVRYIGNDGAHPAKDSDEELEGILTMVDAEDALALAEDFIRILVLNPLLVSERRKKRAGAGQET